MTASHKPMVSIRLLTYNQEKFIAQALDSILAQQVDFDYEIVIGDDFSQDRTIEIARSYQERYPGKINILPRDGKLGRMNNFADTLANCRGKYIAMLDGDDAWGDPSKLQIQVDFLESHLDYAVCCHDAMEIDENNTVVKESRIPPNRKQDFTADELARNTMVMTSTACFRNVEVLHDLPPEFFRAVNADLFIFSLLGQHGKCRCLVNEIKPALYRVHSGGVWSMQTEWKKRFTQSRSQYWVSRYYRRVGLKVYEEGFQYKFLSSYLKLARYLVHGKPPKFSVLRQYVFSNPKKYLDFRFTLGLMKVFVKRVKSFVGRRLFSGRGRVQSEAARIKSE